MRRAGARVESRRTRRYRSGHGRAVAAAIGTAGTGALLLPLARAGDQLAAVAASISPDLGALLGSGAVRVADRRHLAPRRGGGGRGGRPRRTAGGGGRRPARGGPGPAGPAPRRLRGVVRRVALPAPLRPAADRRAAVRQPAGRRAPGSGGPGAGPTRPPADARRRRRARGPARRHGRRRRPRAGGRRDAAGPPGPHRPPTCSSSWDWTGGAETRSATGRGYAVLDPGTTDRPPGAVELREQLCGRWATTASLSAPRSGRSPER